MPPTYFVAVAGNIGVGKSTLTELMSARLGWEPVYEAVDENPYLSDFYADMERWSFHSQAFFLARRLRQHAALQHLGRSVVQDRSVYEDAEIFAHNLYRQGHMSARDWATYFDLYQTLVALLRPPDLVVYLRAQVGTLAARIGGRGRAYEQAVPAAYLEALNRRYDEWIGAFTLCPVLTVETDNLNYVSDSASLEKVIRRIQDRLHGKETLTL
ncbi:MAG: deoxynucleoside kinase [Caldilineaceae bacterium]|nr:deoxynucleoside kinase [Caldilineaceae bacterium]